MVDPFARTTPIDPADLDAKFDEVNASISEVNALVSALQGQTIDISQSGGTLQPSRVGSFSIDGQTFATLVDAVTYVASKAGSGGNASGDAPGGTITPPTLTTATSWDIGETLTYHSAGFTTGTVTSRDLQIWIEGQASPYATMIGVSNNDTFVCPTAAGSLNLWIVEIARWAGTPPVQVASILYPINTPGVPANSVAPSIAPTSASTSDTLTATRGSYTVDGDPVLNSSLTFTERWTVQWTATASFSGGETSCTLTANWGGTTDTYDIYFSNGNTKSVTLTNGSASVSWSGGLTGAATTAIEVEVQSSGLTLVLNANNEDTPVHFYETPTGSGGSGSETEASNTVTPTAPAGSGTTVGVRTVTSTPVGQGTIFASPAGTGVGTVGDPCSYRTAVTNARAGDVVFLRNGTYYVDNHLFFNQAGTSNSPITFESYPGETAVFSSNRTPVYDSQIIVNGSYNVFRNLKFTNQPSYAGVQIWGNNNKFYGCESSDNVGTGFNVVYGASGTVFQDCRANDNDGTGYAQLANGEGTDGFSVSSGSNTTIDHCEALRNSDDNIDLWGNATGLVTWSRVGGAGLGDGNGNGFKAGGDTSSANNVFRNCISYGNLRAGFDCNTLGSVTFDNCTSYNNGSWGYITTSGNVMTDSIGSSNTSGNLSGTPTTQTNNSWQIGGTVTYQSTDPANANFLKPTTPGAFDDIGAYA